MLALRDDDVVIGIVGDFRDGNETHIATSAALESLGAEFEWIDTDTLRQRWADVESLSGIFISPGSPYRDMDAVIDVIRLARERGVPLVGT